MKLRFCTPRCLGDWQQALIPSGAARPAAPAEQPQALAASLEGDSPDELVSRLYELAEHPAIGGPLGMKLPPATGNTLRSLASAIHASDAPAIVEIARSARAVLASRNVEFWEQRPPSGTGVTPATRWRAPFPVPQTAQAARIAVVGAVVVLAMIASRFCGS